MRTYTFELIVNEGNDDFWKGYDPDTGIRRGYATIEEVESMIVRSMDTFALNRDDDYTLNTRNMTNTGDT